MSYPIDKLKAITRVLNQQKAFTEEDNMAMILMLCDDEVMKGYIQEQMDQQKRSKDRLSNITLAFIRNFLITTLPNRDVVTRVLAYRYGMSSETISGMNGSQRQDLYIRYFCDVLSGSKHKDVQLVVSTSFAMILLDNLDLSV